MVTKSRWIPFASFSLLSEFVSAVGQERWHCDMKRGFNRARKKEPEIAAILSKDTSIQRVGHLAQQGVYEFHQDNQLLNEIKGVEQVAQILQLDQELPIVKERIWSILANYYKQPILQNKKILNLNRGDEGFPTPLEIETTDLPFNLFAAIDCMFLEPDGTLHILDFKTGKPNFDIRQGYVYLLMASYLYPNQKAVASFYNLDTCQWSEKIVATSIQLQVIKSKLDQIAKKHDFQIQQYRRNHDGFAQIFPPNPDHSRCKYCQFNSICEFSIGEVSA